MSTGNQERAIATVLMRIQEDVDNQLMRKRETPRCTATQSKSSARMTAKTLIHAALEAEKYEQGKGKTLTHKIAPSKAAASAISMVLRVHLA